MGLNLKTEQNINRGKKKKASARERVGGREIEKCRKKELNPRAGWKSISQHRRSSRDVGINHESELPKYP